VTGGPGRPREIRRDKPEVNSADKSAVGQEHLAPFNGPEVASAEKSAERIANLPDDLAKRVRKDGLNLDEAEHVAAERQKRIGA
jgi:hypothetical protein